MLALSGQIDSCTSVLSVIWLSDVYLDAAAFCLSYYLINNTTVGFICMVSSLFPLPSNSLGLCICLSWR